ncbi:MAG TPA: CxxxxCH/CxxCH domain-containing protein [Anaeromyxobacter sp.]|nr:CxxxxCH/CxxCH domain-containing protein [Anaeromyxobacter sp.]
MALLRTLELASPRRVAALAVLALLAAACDSRRVLEDEVPLCERCHGGGGTGAPPKTPRGESATSARGVGAHRRHLALQGDDVRAALPCETCHAVPTSVDAHLDGVVPVRLLDPITAGGAAARWNPATGRCENVYCHGATLRAGTRGSATAPDWTGAEGTQMTCGSCHLAPPASHAIYAERTRCQRCHAGTVKADGTIDVASGQHIDGTTPTTTACDGCHLAPPDTGAHRAHANPADPASVSYGSLAVGVGTSPGSAPAYVFGCGYCHPLDGAFHQDGTTQVDLLPAGEGVKLLNDAGAAFDPSDSTCSGVYCHGATLGAGYAGADTSPAWTGGATSCASCHAAPPASHAVYATPTQCQRCHSETVGPDGSIDLPSRKHIDGTRTPVPTACDGCHLAPPDGGAHRAHANPTDPASVSYGSLAVDVGTSPADAPAYVFGCGHCHPLDGAKHRDGTAEVDLAPAGGGLRSLNAAAAAFDRAASTCSGVYCHGATLLAGSRGADTSPGWSGSPRTCASCHAAPPASHAVYAAPSECQRCHSATLHGDGSIDLAGREHLDGSTPVPTACDGCHLAPPDTGAHRAHANPADPASVSYGSLAVDVGVSPTGAPAYVFGCGHCHPLSGEPKHRDGTRDVDLAPAGGGLKSLNDPGAAWTQGDSACSGVYCHGATLRVGTQGADPSPAWTGTARTCASCHSSPPASHAGYPGASTCQTCHGATVNPDGTVHVAGMQHVDGDVDAPTGGGCNGCHGAPPDTGVHRVHSNPQDPAAVAYGSLDVLEDVAPSGGPSYDFGCGHCHPLDIASHAAAAPAAQVDLAPPAPPVAGDEIKARNDPAAAFDAVAKTCSSVYCHSSGQVAPAYAAVPAWTSAPGALGCGGCHGNPPRYPSGGPGLADANSHLVLADDGWESGHFLGLPGPWHSPQSKHGGSWGPGEDAAPMTCQTCHADTVDPAAAGPSGFYWLDTTGDHHLPGGDPGRVTSPQYLQLQCTACHDGAVAPLGAGRVLPLRHVNGTREVVFDPRTTLPAIPWLPPPPDAPTRPYWVTNAFPGVSLPDPAIPDAIMEGGTMSLHLGSARYEAATKTCTNAACHLLQAQVTWGAVHGWSACDQCHSAF